MPDNRRQRSEKQSYGTRHRRHYSSIIRVFSENDNAYKSRNNNAVDSVYKHAAYLVHEHRFDVLYDVFARIDIYLLLIPDNYSVFFAADYFGCKPLQRSGNDPAHKKPYERLRQYKNNDLQSELHELPARSDTRCNVIILICIDKRCLGAEHICQHYGHQHQTECQIKIDIDGFVPLRQHGKKRHYGTARHENDSADNEIQFCKQAV